MRIMENPKMDRKRKFLCKSVNIPRILFPPLSIYSQVLGFAHSRHIRAVIRCSASLIHDTLSVVVNRRLTSAVFCTHFGHAEDDNYLAVSDSLQGGLQIARKQNKGQVKNKKNRGVPRKKRRHTGSPDVKRRKEPVQSTSSQDTHPCMYRAACSMLDTALLLNRLKQFTWLIKPQRIRLSSGPFPEIHPCLIDRILRFNLRRWSTQLFLLNRSCMNEHVICMAPHPLIKVLELMYCNL